VSKISVNFADKYPNVDCEQYYESSGENLVYFAYEDWLYNEERIKNNKKTNYAGHVNCFCDK